MQQCSWMHKAVYELAINTVCNYTHLCCGAETSNYIVIQSLLNAKCLKMHNILIVYV